MARSTATMHARPGAAPKQGAALQLLMSLFMALPPPAHVTSRREQLALQRRTIADDDAGSLSMTGGLTIVGVIIGAVVSIAILAALAPTYFASLGDIGAVFTDANTTTGNDDADALLPVFGLLVAFGGLFAIVGLVLLGIKLKNQG